MSKSNLLPKTCEGFASTDYWDSFFKKRGKKEFEWYGEYPELCGLLLKYIRKQDNILVVGCGNSNLSTDLYDANYKQITNIDTSDVVIKQMEKRNKDRIVMKYHRMDVCDLKFEKNSFNVVLDKGTLDAIMPNDKPETIEKVNAMFDNIRKVLNDSGRYICISLLQDHIIRHSLQYFKNHGWIFRVVRCLDAEQKSAINGEIPMPVFMMVCVKCKIPIERFELSLGDSTVHNVTANEMFEAIKSCQQAAVVCMGVGRTRITGGNEVELQLCKPGENQPRYNIQIADKDDKTKNKTFGIFLVPFGRENEWLFSTQDGRSDIVRCAKTDRVAIVARAPGNDITDWAEGREEISEVIRHLAPIGACSEIPFMTIGSDIGKKTVLFKGRSDISGEFIVEDLQSIEGEFFRRLIFTQTDHVIQSESRLKFVKNKGKTQTIANSGDLACQHHVYMVLGVMATLRKNDTCNVLVIGLGGGGLCTFLKRISPQIKIDAVEIDPVMKQVATKWFGLREDGRLAVHIQDGIPFLETALNTGTKYDAILLDVNNKDSTIGMSCPPKQFLEKSVLENIKKCLTPDGVFVLNLVCRDVKRRTEALEKIEEVFGETISKKVVHDLNELVYSTENKCDLAKRLEQAGKDFSVAMTKLHLLSAQIAEIMALLSFED